MENLIATMSVTAPTLFGGAVGMAAYLGLYPPVPRDLGGAPNLDREAERVGIPMPDGDRLDGWFLPGTHPLGVLLLHGYGRSHHRMWRYAGFLRDCGYPLLAIDFRSSRRARRLPTTLGIHELPDARAASRWLACRPGVEATAVMGESLGGTIALMVAAEEPRIAAVIADCPFATGKAAVEDMLGRFLRLPRGPSAAAARALGRWATGRDPYDVDAQAAAHRLGDCPILFIHSTADERLAPAHTEELWKAAGSKDDVWWVPGAGHNQAWLRHRVEYERRVKRFLAEVAAAPAR
jgi:fermentation-respiration switch protein FrsA (DUF1100 family)